MRIVVSGASGLIGTALLAELRRHGHEVVQLVRHESRGRSQVQWDPAAGTLPAEALAGVDAAINLSGAGVGDERWTPEYKRLIRDSRTDSTRTLATALSRLDTPPRVLLNASAMGWYGHRGDEVLTEGSTPGDTFLADVTVDWEAATRPAQDAGIRVTMLRTGLVVAPGGGAFGRLLPLFRLGVGGPLGRGRMWWSWITLHDHLAATRFLLETDLDGPVNLTGPQPVRNAEFTASLGRALHRPAVAAVPTPALRLVLGEFAQEVTASQRVVPQRLLDAGFTFTHSTADQATRWLVSREAEQDAGADLD